jgi:hypothetical protein
MCQLNNMHALEFAVSLAKRKYLLDHSDCISISLYAVKGQLTILCDYIDIYVTYIKVYIFLLGCYLGENPSRNDFIGYHMCASVFEAYIYIYASVFETLLLENVIRQSIFLLLTSNM